VIAVLIVFAVVIGIAVAPFNAGADGPPAPGATAGLAPSAPALSYELEWRDAAIAQ
jgi:hypothetical protein